MKFLGILLVIVGIIGSIVYGIQAMDESRSFEVLGLDVAVSSANWTPLIISLAVLLVGAVILRLRPR